VKSFLQKRGLFAIKVNIRYAYKSGYSCFNSRPLLWAFGPLGRFFRTYVQNSPSYGIALAYMHSHTTYTCLHLQYRPRTKSHLLVPTREAWHLLCLSYLSYSEYSRVKQLLQPAIISLRAICKCDSVCEWYCMCTHTKTPKYLLNWIKICPWPNKWFHYFNVTILSSQVQRCPLALKTQDMI